MKKRVTAGARGLIIATIVFLLFSINGIISSMKSEQRKISSLIEKHALFDGVDNNGDLALRVLNIVKGNIQIDNAQIYYVETTGKIVALEAEINDPEIARLFQLKDHLRDEAIYIGIKTVPKTERKGKTRRSPGRMVVNITSELMVSLAYDMKTSFDFFESTKVENRNFVTSTYVSRLRYISTHVIGFWLSVVGVFIGVLCAIGVFVKVKTNMANYEKAETLFPESRNDLQWFIDYATLNDEAIKLVIFKDHLMSYAKEFIIIDVNDIRKIVLMHALNSKGQQFKSKYKITVRDKANSIVLEKTIKLPLKERAIVFLNQMVTQYPTIEFVNKTADNG